MSRKRTYGWSPERLARINARREDRSEDILMDRKIRGEEYLNKYQKALEASSSKVREKLPSGKNDSIKKMLLEGEELNRAKIFNKRFNPSGSTRSGFSDKDGIFREKLKTSKSIKDKERERSIRLMQNSLDRLSGLA